MEADKSRFGSGIGFTVAGCVVLAMGFFAAMAASEGARDAAGFAAIFTYLGSGLLLVGWVSSICRKFDLRLMEIRDTASKAPTNGPGSGSESGPAGGA